MLIVEIQLDRDPGCGSVLRKLQLVAGEVTIDFERRTVGSSCAVNRKDAGNVRRYAVQTGTCQVEATDFQCEIERRHRRICRMKRSRFSIQLDVTSTRDLGRERERELRRARKVL